MQFVGFVAKNDTKVAQPLRKLSHTVLIFNIFLPQQNHNTMETHKGRNYEQIGNYM